MLESGQVWGPGPAGHSYKTTPPGVPHGALARSRLDELYAGLLDDHQAVAVVGAGGSGKTVQAQLFGRRWPMSMAWLTLDGRDVSGPQLLSDLALAMSPSAPDAPELVAKLLQSDYSVEEVGVLLAEAASEHECLLVVDECDAIAGTDEAMRVLGTFVGHLSAGFQALLLGRSEFTGPIARLRIEDRVARVSDEDLRLTHDEAEAILGDRARETSASHALQVTGGWVAGVAFWPEGQAPDGRPADLTAYLCSEILDRLAVDEQQFLLDTSVLEVVTPRSATAVCGPDAAETWHRLQVRHLPATTTGDGSIVYHPVFRSFLRDQLVQRDAARAMTVSRLYAAHLSASGQFEEATELHLSLDDLEAAARNIEMSVERLYERADWTTLLRQLSSVGEDHIRSRPRLLAARLRALHGLRRFDETRARLREGERLGWLRSATDADPTLIANMAWVTQDEPAEAMRLLDTYHGDYRAEAVRYMITACSGTTPALPPLGAGWSELQRLVSWGQLVQGHLDELIDAVELSDDGPVVDTTLLLALASRGELHAAWRLWERVPDAMKARAQAHFVKAWLLSATSDHAGALRSVEAALTESRMSGFGLYPVYVVFWARILYGLGKLDDAMVVLREVMPTIDGQGKRFLAEWAGALLGACHLQRGELDEAASTLRTTVTSMRAAGRLLFLPMACSYLSEVEARLGHADAAAAAADLALTTTEATGGWHWLRRVLQEVPGVLDRELAHSSDRSGWQRLAPTTTRVEVREQEAPTLLVEVQPFGPHPDLLVNGTALHIGRLKVVELVAYLSLHPRGVERGELQRQLFQDVDQRRGGNHFRQIAHKLHRFTGLRLERGTNGEVSWPTGAVLETADARFEQLVADAAGHRGPEQVRCLREATALLAGAYLEKSDLPWAEQRRYRLDVVYEEVLLETLRLDAAQRDFAGARRTAETLLELNPLCVDAYRHLFDVERATGTDVSCIAVYRRAVRALRELALSPEQVRALLGGARRPLLAVSS